MTTMQIRILRYKITISYTFPNEIRAQYWRNISKIFFLNFIVSLILGPEWNYSGAKKPFFNTHARSNFELVSQLNFSSVARDIHTNDLIITQNHSNVSNSKLIAVLWSKHHVKYVNIWKTESNWGKFKYISSIYKNSTDSMSNVGCFFIVI